MQHPLECRYTALASITGVLPVMLISYPKTGLLEVHDHCTTQRFYVKNSCDMKWMTLTLQTSWSENWCWCTNKDSCFSFLFHTKGNWEKYKICFSTMIGRTFSICLHLPSFRKTAVLEFWFQLEIVSRYITSAAWDLGKRPDNLSAKVITLDSSQFPHLRLKIKLCHSAQIEDTISMSYERYGLTKQL